MRRETSHALYTRGGRGATEICRGFQFQAARVLRFSGRSLVLAVVLFVDFYIIDHRQSRPLCDTGGRNPDARLRRSLNRTVGVLFSVHFFLFCASSVKGVSMPHATIGGLTFRSHYILNVMKSRAMTGSREAEHCYEDLRDGE